MNNICNVCGKVAECSTVVSSFGAFSYSVCEECLTAGKEAYESLVSWIAWVGHFPQDINPGCQALVREQLRLHNKTEEEFIVDVDKRIIDIQNMFNNK